MPPPLIPAADFATLFSLIIIFAIFIIAIITPLSPLLIFRAIIVFISLLLIIFADIIAALLTLFSLFSIDAIIDIFADFAAYYAIAIIDYAYAIAAITISFHCRFASAMLISSAFRHYYAFAICRLRFSLFFAITDIFAIDATYDFH